ncbi:DUF1127 domain-containing protein [Cognatiyoonia sp.]|uniref:DUF1127 domain-containing protein n=1 Tax=Cognatiyoonia sp. TaxID=2211652 RepID=UPI003F698DCA
MASFVSTQPLAPSFFQFVKDGFASLSAALIRGRMLSALHAMSDRELAQVGITRADIPSYSDKLVADAK